MRVNRRRWSGSGNGSQLSPTFFDRLAAHGATLALVVGHADLLPDTVRIAQQFRATGQAVWLFLLAPAAEALNTDGTAAIEKLQVMSAGCYCNHRPTAKRLGLTFADVAAMATGIDAAEWVLTF